MRAIRVHAVGGPEVLKLETIPGPAPAAGQVALQVEAAGVNYIEVYQRTGTYKVPLPGTPGAEAAGTVSAVGDGVSEWKPGDRVVTADALGSYADDALVPADRLVRIPDGVTTKQAAAVMLQGMTAHYLALSTYPLKPGDTCLVHAAAGGVGLLLCEIAKRCGARVIGVTSTPEKAALAREAGADEVLLYGEQDFAAETRRLIGGKGVQVVYDSVGRDTFDASLRTLVTRGTMVLFGASSGPVPPFDPQILNQLGSLFVTRPRLGHYTATREELTARAGDVLGWVRDGSLRVRVFREYPLVGAAQAQRDLESRKTSGKLLLIP